MRSLRYFNDAPAGNGPTTVEDAAHGPRVAPVRLLAHLPPRNVEFGQVGDARLLRGAARADQAEIAGDIQSSGDGGGTDLGRVGADLDDQRGAAPPDGPLEQGGHVRDHRVGVMRPVGAKGDHWGLVLAEPESAAQRAEARPAAGDALMDMCALDQGDPAVPAADEVAHDRIRTTEVAGGDVGQIDAGDLRGRPRTPLGFPPSEVTR